MKKLGALAVWLIVVLSSLSVAEDVSLSLDQYKSQLEQYRDEIRTIRDHPEHAVDFNRSVPSSFRVETQAGTISVPLEFLHKGLQKYLTSTPNLRPDLLSHLGDRIKAMQDEADSFGGAHAGDSATRERLNQILSAREFAKVRGPTQWELLQQRINTWFDEKWNKLFPNAPDIDQLGQIFVWIMIAVASSVLAVWLYRQSRERLLDGTREVVSFVPSAKSWRSWLAEARAEAARGAWREAIHLAYWAAVSRLEGDGLWRPDKTRTPREYLNAIPAANGAKPIFAVVTRTFEASWYGGRPASAEDFARFMTEIENLGCRG